MTTAKSSPSCFHCGATEGISGFQGLWICSDWKSCVERASQQLFEKEKEKVQEGKIWDHPHMLTDTLVLGDPPCELQEPARCGNCGSTENLNFYRTPFYSSPNYSSNTVYPVGAYLCTDRKACNDRVVARIVERERLKLSEKRKVNPHPATITDEVSGTVVPNTRYLDWQEGYSAGRVDEYLARRKGFALYDKQFEEMEDGNAGS